VGQLTNTPPDLDPDLALDFPPERRTWRSYIRYIRLGLALLMVIIAGVVFITSRSSKAGAGEIIRHPVDVPGTNTFTPSVAAPAPANAAAVNANPPASNSGLIQAKGDAPGLYAGARDVPSCNASALVGYLTSNPDKAAAWAGASGIDAANIKGFVDTLTPVLLRVDTRVTEYQFGGGKAIPKQAVLQSGTAVFLDRSAFPRIRCASGNPLSQPRAITSSPSYTGPTWPGFSPTTLVVITPTPTPVALVLIDIRTGAVFVRIPGSIIIIDIDRPALGIVIIIVEPGGPFTVTGTGFPPGAALTVTFDNPAVTLATPAADGAGNFTVRVNAPVGAAPGIHQVTTTGGGVSLPQPVYVIPPAV
jgi:hypothetical protein